MLWFAGGAAEEGPGGENIEVREGFRAAKNWRNICSLGAGEGGVAVGCGLKAEPEIAFAKLETSVATSLTRFEVAVLERWSFFRRFLERPELLSLEEEESEDEDGERSRLSEGVEEPVLEAKALATAFEIRA